MTKHKLKLSLLILVLLVTITTTTIVDATSANDSLEDDSADVKTVSDNVKTQTSSSKIFGDEVDNQNLLQNTSYDTLYANSKAEVCEGTSRDSPTTLADAIDKIYDGGTIYLVADNTDNYQFNKTLGLNNYYRVKSLNLIGEKDKSITFEALNTSILDVYNYNLNISNINFINSNSTYSSAVDIQNSNVNIVNCSFNNNHRMNYGGALNIRSSNVKITQSNFTNNTACYGGAVYIEDSTVNMAYTTFSDNNASYGGAISSKNSDSSMKNCLIKDNTALYAAGIYSFNNTLDVQITNFTNNTAKDYGGCILQLDQRKLNIYNSVLEDNTALTGAGVYVLYSNTTIKSTLSKNNKATQGSFIYSYNNTVTLNDNAIVDSDELTQQVYINNATRKDINNNWWGQNVPDYTIQTNNITPDTWIQVAYTKNSTKTRLYYQLTNSTNYTSQLPKRNTNTNKTIPCTISNTNATIKVDNQTIDTSKKLEAYIYMPDVATRANTTITLNITSTPDISGNITLTVNTYNIKQKITQNTTIKLNITNTWKNSYNMTLTYTGNSKYQNKTITKTLRILDAIDTTNKITRINPSNQTTTTTTLPSMYDLRLLNQTTPVKSQGSSGSCVVFATTSAIESTLKKANNTTYDLSENNLKNILKRYSPIGFQNLDPNDGGYDFEPIGAMASWLAPILEKDDPYEAHSQISAINNNTIRIQDVYIVPNRQNYTDNTLIKEAIMKYGAVYTGVKLSSSTNQYTNNTNKSNHAVAIVGWDDNYSRNNFYNTPPGDGAFIIKNSWGESTGNNGYQYVSYYDSVIGNIPYKDDYNTINFAVIYENTENYTGIYQYDTVVYVYTFNYTQVKDSFYYKNIYTIKEDETLAAIGTYFIQKSDYQITVNVNNKTIHTQTGHTDITGYNTIPLNNYYHVQKDDELTVIVKITPETTDSRTRIALHDNDYPTSTQPNKSYLSLNGKKWIDTYDYTTEGISASPIKVYTRSVPKTKTSTKIANDTLSMTTTLTNSDNVSKITYKINNKTVKTNTNISDITTTIYNISTLSNGKYNLTTDTYYDNLIITHYTSFTVTDNNMTITVKSLNTTVNTPTTLNVTIKNNKANIVNDGIIVMQYQNNTIITEAKVRNSQALLNFTFDTVATYTLTIKYMNSTIYPESQTSTTITVNKLNTTNTIKTVISIIGEKLQLTANITDSNKKAVTNGYVIFKLNGITIKDNGKLTGSSNPLKIYVKNGIAQANLTADLDMRHAQNMTSVYSGSKTYQESRSNNAKAQILLRNASIVVTSNVKIIKQGQYLTLTAKVYDITSGKRSTKIINHTEQFVYFKVNGITLKNPNGTALQVKVVNGTATIKYYVPIGLSGVTDGKTFNIKNHTILAGFANPNYYPTAINTSTFQVERSNITINFNKVTVNNKTHKITINATIKDYLGNYVIGPNKICIKINGITLKTNNKTRYFTVTNGIINIKDLSIPSYNAYTKVEIVTQDRLSYKSGRNSTTKISLIN
ncbi:MAG: hypothetical protein BZ136_01155 [Methanosphaera sp. rholeuAM74]|nr:MAG: hypothetical protein BZ136_01155 [Methanosphaera sp. rholeuAM74]